MPDVKTDISPGAATGIVFNRIIETMLSSGGLAIDIEYGWEQLNRYLLDIALVACGVPYAELGISRRREASAPALLVPASSGSLGYNLVSNARLYNSDATPAGSIAWLRLTGVMQTESAGSSRDVYDFADDLRAAYRNTNVSSVVIETNSGGGEATAGEVARATVGERNKPVLSYVHRAGSAAYMTVGATDEIIAANESARLGGIGTYISLDRQRLDEYKARVIDVYSDASFGKNKEVRAALEGDYSLIKATVTEMTAQFQNFVKGARPLTGDTAYLQHTLSGEMFAARDAKRRGLVDNIGSMDMVVKRAAAWTSKYAKAAKQGG